MIMTVCFCHGRESGPWGSKIRRLARVAEQFGCRVVSCDDRDTPDPDERVRRLLTREGLATPLILVGSSMGAYVAAIAAGQLRPAGLFLMAPAFGIPGYQAVPPLDITGRVEIVHGWDDTIVPLANVLEFAERQGSALHLLPDGHTLHRSLDRIARLFADFLACCQRATQTAAPRELLATL